MGAHPELEDEEALHDLVFSDPDGTPLTLDELARSLDEAVAELERTGPVPAEEVRDMLEAVFAEYEREHDTRRGITSSPG